MNSLFILLEDIVSNQQEVIDCNYLWVFEKINLIKDTYGSINIEFNELKKALLLKTEKGVINYYLLFFDCIRFPNSIPCIRDTKGNLLSLSEEQYFELQEKYENYNNSISNPYNKDIYNNLAFLKAKYLDSVPLKNLSPSVVKDVLVKLSRYRDIMPNEDYERFIQLYESYH